MRTTITNTMHNYSKTVTTKGFPCFDEINIHVIESKPSDCQSTTVIEIKEDNVVTVISNDFNGFLVNIETKSIPAISTIKKALKRSKPKGCKSLTNITVDGIYYDLVDMGNGLELRARF